MLLCCCFLSNDIKQNQQRELHCTVLTLLIPNMLTSTPIQISSKSVTSPWHCEGGSTQLAKGSSLLMHVIGEALVWVSDFRLQRLCAPWSPGEVGDGNLITEQQTCCIQCYRPIRSVKGYTAGLCLKFFASDRNKQFPLPFGFERL